MSAPDELLTVPRKRFDDLVAEVEVISAVVADHETALSALMGEAQPRDEIRERFFASRARRRKG